MGECEVAGPNLGDLYKPCSQLAGPLSPHLNRVSGVNNCAQLGQKRLLYISIDSHRASTILSSGSKPAMQKRLGHKGMSLLFFSYRDDNRGLRMFCLLYTSPSPRD